MSNSENEDDPAIYESSGSEWSSSTEVDTKRRTRRASARTSKKAKIKSQSTTSDSEAEKEHKPRKKCSVNKKQKLDSKILTSGTNSTVKKNLPRTITSKDFTTGSFLIAKKDAQLGDPNKHPCIWRIDGKALLQKYEPFEEDGKIRHKTTSIYTGWSSLDRDLYAPISVTISCSGNQSLIVDLNWEKLKEINMDSD